MRFIRLTATKWYFAVLGGALALAPTLVVLAGGDGSSSD